MMEERGWGPPATCCRSGAARAGWKLQTAVMEIPAENAVSCFIWCSIGQEEPQSDWLRHRACPAHAWDRLCRAAVGKHLCCRKPPCGAARIPRGICVAQPCKSRSALGLDLPAFPPWQPRVPLATAGSGFLEGHLDILG